MLVNLARFVKVDPEQALRRTNAKFRERFGYIERKLAERGKNRRATPNIEEMEALWQEAKVGDRDPPAYPLSTSFDSRRICRRPSGDSTEIDLLPLRFFVVASRVGGQVLGAYDGERMIGFCLAIPGIKPGRPAYLHSHMLGVLPEYRNAGVGRRLKLRQREDALARGIR